MKRLTSLIIAGCLLAAGTQQTAVAQESAVTVKIDGVVQSFDVPPTLKDGRVLVPFRKILESLGAEVSWDPATKTVVADKSNTEVVLRINEKGAYVNEVTLGGKRLENDVELDVPAEISNGRTLVPLRFVSESFDAKVEWVAQEKLVLITTVPSASFIPDKGLEETIRLTLDKKGEPLSTEDMKSLNSLAIKGGTIDLTGLEHATNLRYLDLRAEQVQNLEVLGSLTSLEDLYLRSVQTKDLGFLKKLPNLKTLRIIDMPVEDLSPAANLSKLTELSITKAPVKSIEPLAGLTQLQALFLEETQITDLTPVENLANLERFSSAANPVADVTPLQELSALTEVTVYGSEVSDASPLAKLENLQTLYLYDNKLTDIDFASSLTQLQRLDVSDNRIAAIPSLQKAAKLKSLDLEGNPVKDISPLKGHPALEELVLIKTDVANISTLTSLPLKIVMLNETPIDWNANSQAVQVVQQLEQKGVEVYR